MKEKCCPRTPKCCDMRGMLSFSILWTLSKGSKNGQQICEELKKRKGVKPTPGTIYPALKNLRSKKLVTMKKEGRATVYSMTKQGEQELKEACNYFCNVFGEIFEQHTEE